jgi:hypothetical protein
MRAAERGCVSGRNSFVAHTSDTSEVNPKARHRKGFDDSSCRKGDFEARMSVFTLLGWMLLLVRGIGRRCSYLCSRFT